MGWDEVGYIAVLYGLEPEIEGELDLGHREDELQVAVGVGFAWVNDQFGVGDIDNDIELTNKCLSQAIN